MFYQNYSFGKCGIFKMSINLPIAILISSSSSGSTVTAYDAGPVSASVIRNKTIQISFTFEHLLSIASDVSSVGCCTTQAHKFQASGSPGD